MLICVFLLLKNVSVLTVKYRVVFRVVMTVFYEKP